ncbi:hypothetical protein D5S17_20095 [Pseudonocardiaceae bacterium YIM PH 21723]|nr:hypothetical protein D5S17_20095 [Pseudonocardiaceae bacterium YIM PH 21723]
MRSIIKAGLVAGGALAAMTVGGSSAMAEPGAVETLKAQGEALSHADIQGSVARGQSDISGFTVGAQQGLSDLAHGDVQGSLTHTLGSLGINR